MAFEALRGLLGDKWWSLTSRVARNERERRTENKKTRVGKRPRRARRAGRNTRVTQSDVNRGDVNQEVAAPAPTARAKLPQLDNKEFVTLLCSELTRLLRVRLPQLIRTQLATSRFVFAEAEKLSAGRSRRFFRLRMASGILPLCIAIVFATGAGQISRYSNGGQLPTALWFVALAWAGLKLAQQNVNARVLKLDHEIEIDTSRAFAVKQARQLVELSEIDLARDDVNADFSQSRANGFTAPAKLMRITGLAVEGLIGFAWTFCVLAWGCWWATALIGASGIALLVVHTERARRESRLRRNKQQVRDEGHFFLLRFELTDTSRRRCAKLGDVTGKMLERIQKTYEAQRKRWTNLWEAYWPAQTGALFVTELLLIGCCAAFLVDIVRRPTGFAQWVMVMAAAAQFAASLKSSTEAAGSYLSASNEVAVFQRFLGYKTELTGTRTLPLDGPPPDICFENVEYTYPKQRDPNGKEKSPVQALKRVSFSVRGGSKVALVGFNGAGKTSVVSALVRHIKPQSGLITVGGIPLQDLSQDCLSRLFAVVPQKILFHVLSIRENLLAPRQCRRHDKALMKRVMKLTGSSEVVRKTENRFGHVTRSMPEGDGDLSEGQLQRLVLARELLKTSPVIIMDEPTAHLDAPTRHTVYQELASEVGNRTLILITHDLDVLEHVVDHIIVLNDGVIDDQGSFADLANREGDLFAKALVQRTFKRSPDQAADPQ